MAFFQSAIKRTATSFSKRAYGTAVATANEGVKKQSRWPGVYIIGLFASWPLIWAATMWKLGHNVDRDVEKYFQDKFHKATPKI